MASARSSTLFTKQRRWLILLRYEAYWLHRSYTHVEDDAASWQTSEAYRLSVQRESGVKGCVTKPPPNRDGCRTPPIDITPLFLFYCGFVKAIYYSSTIMNFKLSLPSWMPDAVSVRVCIATVIFPARQELTLG